MRPISRKVWPIGFSVKMPLPMRIAIMAIGKWAWSGVHAATASISPPISSSILRKSLYRFAFGNFFRAFCVCLAPMSVSQSATMLQRPVLANDCMSCQPWLPMPHTARFTLSPGFHGLPPARAGTNGNTPAASAACRNERRDVLEFILRFLGGRGLGVESLKFEVRSLKFEGTSGEGGSYLKERVGSNGKRPNFAP